MREGQVRNTRFYVVMGMTTSGERDILGIWAGGQSGEGARFWFQVFTELKNRGVADVLIAVCDGLKGWWILLIVDTGQFSGAADS